MVTHSKAAQSVASKMLIWSESYKYTNVYIKQCLPHLHMSFWLLPKKVTAL